MDTHYRTECQDDDARYLQAPRIYAVALVPANDNDDEETELWTAGLCVGLVATALFLVYAIAAQGAEIAETGVQIVLSGL